MATIRGNIERVLAELGIQGLVEIPDTARPDRLFFYDTLGELEKHMADHPEHWSEDFIPDHFHGKSLRHSFRERLRPSMQCCEHEISLVNQQTLPPDQRHQWFWEIDFDEAGPNSLEGIFIHGEEVFVNALTGDLTNQNDIAGKLDRRLAA